MKIDTLLLPMNQLGTLTRAAEIIQAGGVIAFPTDTVYGIGVSAFDQAAIEKIYRVKVRAAEKAIPVLLGDLSGLSKIAVLPSPAVNKIINKFWPGALTLILPLLPGLPGNLSTTQTIGVRIPNFKLTRELLNLTGPLAATSANLSGLPSALTAGQVSQSLGGKIDLILDGGTAPGGVASTVLDCTGEKFQILREGPISLEMLKEELEKP